MCSVKGGNALEEFVIGSGIESQTPVLVYKLSAITTKLSSPIQLHLPISKLYCIHMFES